METVNRLIKISLLCIPLLTLGIYCDPKKSDGDEVIYWFGRDEFPDGPVIEENLKTTVPPTNSILEDLDPLTAKDYTSLWVNQTDLEYTSSGTESYWNVQVVNGNDTQSFDSAAGDIQLSVRFDGANSETMTATTDANGWATFTRAKGKGAEQMYITDLSGELPWNCLDQEFWQNQPALSITADAVQ